MRTAALLAAVLVGGCGLPSIPPEWVVNRAPLPSCGEEALQQGQAGDPDVRTCLLDAYLEGRGAELISTSPTIEGDPITQYIRVHENGVVEIFVDATRDRYGSGSWERIVCDELVRVDKGEFPPGRVFSEEGCEQLPVP